MFLFSYTDFDLCFFLLVPLTLAKDGKKGMCLKSDYRNYAYMANLDYIKCVGLAYDYNYCPGMCDGYGAIQISPENSTTILPH